MYRLSYGQGFYSSPYHLKELAEIDAKSFNARVEKTPFFMQPTFTMLHEWNLLKLIKAM